MTKGPKPKPVGPSGSRGGHRKVRPDEADLWQSAMGDVHPMQRDDNKVRTPNAAKSKGPTAQPRLHPAPVVSPPNGDPELRHGAAPGLDKRSAQRLKRGQLQIEGRIDLHGMTQTEAHRTLVRFIQNAREADKRCVLVITGKGLRRDGSIGILRESVPRWLNEPGLRPKVLSFTHAQPKDGGEGALYVLLKRRRS